ncbi:hypothetical protein HanIR_Chr09g0420011 [Helianthus annuus]|nr:hypothetical protein HanIR_Chr09g0420011 [Helianthus annuus]
MLCILIFIQKIYIIGFLKTTRVCTRVLLLVIIRMNGNGCHVHATVHPSCICNHIQLL